MNTITIVLFLFYLPIVYPHIPLRLNCNDACIKLYNHGGIKYTINGTSVGCKCNTNCCAGNGIDCDILCLDNGYVPIIYDYRCGSVINKTCSGNWSRDCCSSNGYCGKSETYCGKGCQNRYSGRRCLKTNGVPGNRISWSLRRSGTSSINGKKNFLKKCKTLIHRIYINKGNRKGSPTSF